MVTLTFPIGVIVVFPIVNDSPSIDNLFNDFRDLKFIVLDGCGILIGLLSMADTGPGSPGKQMIAKNQ